MIYLLIPIISFLDRLRGDNRGPGGVLEAILMGMLIHMLIAPLSLYTPLFGVLWALGAATGWGAPIGAALLKEPMVSKHKWQFWIFKTNTYAALTLRGFIWGLPVLCAEYWIPGAWKAALAMTIAFPLSCWLSALTPHYDFQWKSSFLRDWCPNRWKLMEWVRGALCASIVVML